MAALSESSISTFNRKETSPSQQFSVLVLMELANKAGLKEHFVVGSRERLPDLLIDERRFPPFRTVEGSIRSLNKRHIVGVQEILEPGRS